jgi:hypothetical protein
MLDKMKTTSSGAYAETLAKELSRDEPTLKKIGATPSELRKLVGFAWNREAYGHLNSMRFVRTPLEAEKERAAFFRAQIKSGLPVTRYNTSEKEIDRLVGEKHKSVALQELEAALGNGVRLNQAETAVYGTLPCR